MKVGSYGSYKFFAIKLMWSDMPPKVIQNNGSAVSKELAELEYDFLHIVRHIKIHLFDSVLVCGCSHAHLRMPKEIPNIKHAIFSKY